MEGSVRSIDGGQEPGTTRGELGAACFTPEPSAEEAASAHGLGRRARWLRRSRVVAGVLWLAVGVGYIYVGYVLWGPGDLESVSSVYLWFWYVAFVARVFAFQAGLALVLLAVVALLLRRYRAVLAVLPLLAVTLGPDVRQCFVSPPQGTEAAVLRVMSVNLLCNNCNRAQLIAEIEAAEADVVLFQEYTYVWHDELQAALGDLYPHVLHVRRRNPLGTAIYSKLSFVGQPVVRRRLENLPELHATVEYGGRAIRLYNVHLLPPRLSLVSKMRAQFRELLQDLREEQGPVIMGGDFNYTERVRAHDLVRQAGFADAHEAAGWGRGATWPVSGNLRYLPGIRLDRVYLGCGLRAMRCRTGVGAGSDHRPVIVDVAVE